MTSRFEEVSPARYVEGALKVPGDKSITHRALLLALIGEGSCTIANPSPAADVRSTAMAVGQLSDINSHLKHYTSLTSSLSSDFQIQAYGSGWALDTQGEPIDVGNSGTTIRLLTGILSASNASATLTGDASIRRRPMGRVVDPLRRMGARIQMSEAGTPPVVVEGTELQGCDHRLPVASAQVKTALLLAGLRAAGETSVSEPTKSRDHTERMLRYFGVSIGTETERLVVKSTHVRLRDIDVPGDLSSAAPLLAAAAVLPGSDLLIQDVGLNPTRTGFLDVLRRFGAIVEVTEGEERAGEPRGDVRVRAADRRPLEVSGATVVEAIDELPLVAVLGAFAEGSTVVHDASELRVKESDRITAICTALAALGVDITPRPDGFVVTGTGGGLTSGEVDAASDHRIAMAAAVAALGAAGPVRIKGWDAIAVSYPGFGADLLSVVVR